MRLACAQTSSRISTNILGVRTGVPRVGGRALPDRTWRTSVSSVRGTWTRRSHCHVAGTPCVHDSAYGNDEGLSGKHMSVLLVFLKQMAVFMHQMFILEGSLVNADKKVDMVKQLLSDQNRVRVPGQAEAPICVRLAGDLRDVQAAYHQQLGDPEDSVREALSQEGVVFSEGILAGHSIRDPPGTRLVVHSPSCQCQACRPDRTAEKGRGAARQNRPPKLHLRRASAFALRSTASPHQNITASLWILRMTRR